MKIQITKQLNELTKYADKRLARWYINETINQGRIPDKTNFEEMVKEIVLRDCVVTSVNPVCLMDGMARNSDKLYQFNIEYEYNEFRKYELEAVSMYFQVKPIVDYFLESDKSVLELSTRLDIFRETDKEIISEFKQFLSNEFNIKLTVAGSSPCFIKIYQKERKDDWHKQKI